MMPKTAGRSHGQSTLDAPSTLAGVPSGAIILTLDGELPVEHLMPGDRIVTRDSGTATLKSVHRHQLRGRFLRILAGSLGDTRPDRDVILPENQHILVRDWRAKALFGLRQVAAPIGALLDGEFITSEGMLTMTLYDLRFDSDHVIYADGLELVMQAKAAQQASAA